MQRRRAPSSQPLLSTAVTDDARVGAVRPAAFVLPPGADEATDEIKPISVAELDRKLKRLVEGQTANLHVEGEISGLNLAASGHAYFTLKDGTEEAAIDCVMYRMAPPRAKKLLAEGARVILIGRATVYAPRGRLQFQVEDARQVGRGALLEALERLKEKLASEGLFAPERKRPLPPDPRVIGVVTSPNGAAIHDIVKVAFRRGAVRIVLAPAVVQGPGAAPQMVRALALLERVPEVEAIILGRGGGSADDLSAFNDELLVRQVAATRVPVVSAVGHEIDVSLTDLVADARAATPSQAAEMLVPDSSAREAELEHLASRLERAVERRLDEQRVELERLVARLGTPDRLLAAQRQMLDDALDRMEAQLDKLIARRRAEVIDLERRLSARHPSAVIAAARRDLGPLESRLVAAMQRNLANARHRLAGDAARLDALSPLAVLGRGYAIATNAKGRAIRDVREVSTGEAITVRLHHGSFRAKVVASTTSNTASPPPSTPPPQLELWRKPS